MDTIQESGVCAHFRRERIKQTTRFQQHIHALIDIAYKYHRSGGSFLFFSTGKGTRCHIVLHDLDAIFILELDARHLVKSNTVPQTDQADGLSAHVVEKIGNSGLTAGNQNTVWRDFLVQMALTSGAWAKFAKVIIVLHQRDHTKDQQPLLTGIQRIRLHANGSEEHIHPFFLSECFSTCL